jgi:hypothetical protein
MHRLQKFYDHGVCLELFHEDKDLYHQLRNLYSRFVALSRTSSDSQSESDLAIGDMSLSSAGNTTNSDEQGNVSNSKSASLRKTLHKKDHGGDRQSKPGLGRARNNRQKS